MMYILLILLAKERLANEIAYDIKKTEDLGQVTSNLVGSNDKFTP